MMFWALIFLHGAHVTGSQPSGNIGSPENITVQVLDPKTVQVFWSSVWSNVERFDVTYNPTEDKIVSQAAGNSQSIVLRELRPDTQYQITITAVIGGRNYKSRRIVFRTAPDSPLNSETYPTQASYEGKGPTMASTKYVTVDPTAKYMPQTSSTVRGVELGLVLLALVVWIVAIALFFHRWGKIRMLLPYQPDYKTQQALKVPGTGTTMGSGCSGNAGTEGQQDGPGCIQHMRWSSNCSDERSTAKKWRRGPGGSPARLPTSYLIREDCTCCDSPEIVTHSTRRNDISAESIALCQLNRSPRKKAALNKSREKLKGSDNKQDNPLDNISDSIQSLLGCTSAFCQKKNLAEEKRQYGREVARSELEPLFFVGDKGMYREDPPDTSIVVHHGRKEEAPTENPKPKRYTRSSFKKQKVSLYNEKELDLYMKVPIMESELPKMEDKATETDKPKSSSSSSRDTAEIKRKAFLRKISLQDTYLNYNQDYWLDYKKSVRFHKSIDLGYFGNEDKATEPAGAQAEKPKRKLSERITEKSSEMMEEPPQVRRTANTAVMADFRKCSGAAAAKSFFFLPSNENIPLFFERNGNIETDFDSLTPEDERLPIGKTEQTKVPSTDSSDRYTPDVCDVKSGYDFSKFYEIKLEPDPVRRSTIFNFQGGHAFFGEGRYSNSDDSDVFYNDNDLPEASSDRSNYPERILYVSGSEKSNGMV